MDAKYYNGEPERQHDPGRSYGVPDPYVCLDCDWKGRGALARANHYSVTKGHRTVWAKDPRAANRQIRKAG